MMIRQLEKHEYQSDALLSLLLLADPDREMIASYLYESILFVVEAEEILDIDNAQSASAPYHQIIGVIALQQIAQDSFEIMNLAVVEAYRQQGIGRQLLMHAMDYSVNAGIAEIKVATGNSSVSALRLYQQCGFTIDKVMADYFVIHYPEPIYEEGIQCWDRIELVYRMKSAYS